MNSFSGTRRCNTEFYCHKAIKPSLFSTLIKTTHQSDNFACRKSVRETRFPAINSRVNQYFGHATSSGFGSRGLGTQGACKGWGNRSAVHFSCGRGGHCLENIELWTTQRSCLKFKSSSIYVDQGCIVVLCYAVRNSEIIWSILSSLMTSEWLTVLVLLSENSPF